MNYQIIGLCPSLEHHMGGWGFGIRLFPAFKTMVTESGITAEQAYTVIEKRGRVWLDGCGFNAMFDPDNCGAFAEKNLPAQMPTLSTCRIVTFGFLGENGDWNILPSQGRHVDWT